MTHLTRRILLTGAAAALAGCGRRRSVAPVTGPTIGSVSAPLSPPAFADSDPHDWPGRTPAAYPVHGIDISRWQAGIDWARARAAGVNFVWIKGTEGGDIADPELGAHSEESLAAGIPTGAYHFWYHCRDGASQARWFIRHVARVRGSLPPVLDVEFTPRSPTCAARPDPGTLRRELQAFIGLVGSHYRTAPVVYTTPDIHAYADLGRLTGAEFWLRSTANHPSATYPGARWTFWQYSGTGRVPGISGDVDLNAFRGSPAQWRDWLTARAVP
jgi:lysozyme